MVLPNTRLKVRMEEKPEEIRTLPILLRKQIAIKRWCVLRPAFLFIDEVFSELTVEESEAMLSYLETEQKNGVNIVLFINMQEMNSLLNAINGTV